MKQYVVDEIRPKEYETLKAYLDDRFTPQFMDGLYWLFLDKKLYSENQKNHAACHPYCFALELKESAVCAELLVRSQKRMRCDCVAYATDEQRHWLLKTIDDMFETLQLKT